MRIILTNQNTGRVVRDEQFSWIDERDMRKALNRAIRAVFVAEAKPGESVDFRLTIFGGQS